MRGVRRGTSGRRRQKDSAAGWGQAWALWLHIEMTPEGAADTRPLEARLPPDIVLPGDTLPSPDPGGFTVPTLSTLRPGAVGWDVQILQSMLNLQLDGPDLATDGVYGPRTENHVTLFQATKRLSVDRVVGPKTWAALFAPRPA